MSLLEDGYTSNKPASKNFGQIRSRSPARNLVQVLILGGVVALGSLIILQSITSKSRGPFASPIDYESTSLDTQSFSLQERLQLTFPYNRKAKSQFPTYIWQTWKNRPGDDDFAEYLPPLVESWSQMNPNHTHISMNDDQASNLIKSLYSPIPEVHEAYVAMPHNVHRADFFRYLILFAQGGTYSDIDTNALKPINRWLPKNSMPEEDIGIVVGIENDANREDWAQYWVRKVAICQWTIHSKPGHPLLGSIIAKIIEDTSRMEEKGILSSDKMDKPTLEYTGPGIWTDTVYEYLSDPRYFTIQDKRDSIHVPLGSNVTWSDLTGLKEHRLLGDLLLLPITSFSPGLGHMGSEPVDHPMAFVKHNFQGRSRPEY